MVVEGKFDKFVCDRATFHHGNKPYNKRGKYFLSTLEQKNSRPSDRFTGVAESPVFVLKGPEVSLLVGGGKHGNTYVALCTLDGKERLKARGANAQFMQSIAWLAPQLVGKKVFLRIVDRHTGGWGHVTLDHFVAKGTLDPEATRQRFAGIETRRLKQQLQDMLKQMNLKALRLAIEDLARTYPTEYSNSKELLAKLARFENLSPELNRIASGGTNKTKLASDLVAEFRSFQREALIANPLVSGRPIVYCVRAQFRRGHHNTETMCHLDSVKGAIKTVDFGKGAEVKTLVSAADGVARDMDVHFSGSKIVFSMRKNRADNHSIYEINADGSGLKRLTTASGPQLHDIDPLYLPDGSIAFSSTREPKFCGCNQHIMCNLFRMSADGSNIHQISKNALHDGHGTLTPDGRILYDRWEYVDRNFGDAQALWTVNPDGTNQSLYWGNNTGSPGAVLDGRIIPGTQLVLATFSSCHDRPWGALAIVDRRLGMDGRSPVIRTWPESAVNLVNERGGFDTFTRVRPKYEDPYPLSDKYFLCSRMIGKGEQMGIYLIDVFGNEILLHTEEPGCFDPIPLAPRKRPPVIPSRRNFTDEVGTFYVADVYKGTYMEGVKRGQVKYLRVVEAPEKRFYTGPAWGGQGVEKPAMNWRNFENKRILGTVPVEKDGSAYFEVPANRFVFFQLLDEDRMMVQSMRSGTVVQPGETTGCIGCHDNRRSAPSSVNPKPLLATSRPPSKMDGWYGEPRLFGYMKEVQPVFEKHCVSCHDFKKPGGDLILAGDRNPFFNASYVDLWRSRKKRFIQCVGAGPAAVQKPYSWGSHASRLTQVIRKGHEDVKLSREESDRINTWLDLNAPYYGLYTSAYPKNAAGRSPLDGSQLAHLQKLTGVNFRSLGKSGRRLGPQISFERPELSPCLKKLKESDERYTEALAIIRSGKQKLAENPRADMDGHQPCATDQQRQKYYDQRLSAEINFRSAIGGGRKLYDSPMAQAENQKE